MGVNIHIRDEAGGYHPDWDPLRFGGDRELAAKVGGDALEVSSAFDGDIDLIRPVHINELVDAMTREHPENAWRWKQLAEILNGSQRWWIYLSW